MRLEINHICKSYGDNQVLRDISYQAHSGSAFGLLGRNGAGKTTSIRIIMGVFPPDSGSVTVDGQPISKANVTFGYLPEERGLYPKKTIKEQLLYIGELKGLSSRQADQNAKEWMSRMELGAAYVKRLDTLSKGNQQKVQLIAALIHNPDIVILDEPFSGMDPVNAQLFKNIFQDLIKQGKTILFSSHQMSYVEEFCENLAIINHGKIVLNGNLRQIKRSYDRTRILLHFDGQNEKQPDVWKNHLQDLDIIEAITPQPAGVVVKLKHSNDKDLLFHTLASRNIGVERFEVMEPTLEDIFVEKAGDVQ